MSNIYTREKNLLNIGIGLLSGLCLSILFYLLIFSIQNFQFTFQLFFALHASNPVVFLIDLLPFACSLLAYFIVYTNEKYKIQYEKALYNEKKKIDQALQLSKNLTHGKLTGFEKRDVLSNELSDSLDELRETLLRNKEAEELRARDDQRRNWASEGLAMFGEILRIQEEKMEDLAYKLISNLVKYLKANQGGFFLIEGEPPATRYLQMIACHAYDRKKFADKRIEWGEGLIGTCALEKKTIYLLDIPDQYLTITSGLGKANPDALIMVPLLVNNEVQGIIEIASFSRFEEYQIEFIEKVADSIAMTLSNIKGNLRTSTLLRETRIQTEELALQDEKMRRNMEELKSTQEQAARQAEKFISFTNSVNHTMIRAEYDKEGYLLYANTKFLKKLGYSGNREVEGRHISLFINDKDRAWFNEIWDSLGQGGKHFEGYMKHITKQGQDLWTMATYTSIRNDDGSVEKILFLAIDTTEQKKQSLDFEGQIAALNRMNLKAEFTPDGKILSTNELFNEAFKFTEKEMQQMSVFDFMKAKELESFNELWENVIIGKPYQGKLKFINKYEEEKWLRLSFTAVNDMYEEVAKVLFVATEITNEIIMEIESRKQTEQLKQHEEKLRFASIELNRKTEEKINAWQKQKIALENEKDLLREIALKSNDAIISFDNSGILLFVNKSAENLWKIKSKSFIGLPALECFRDVQDFPVELINILDPAKSKNMEKSMIEFGSEGGKKKNIAVKLIQTENSGKIVYTLFLNPCQK